MSDMDVGERHPFTVAVYPCLSLANELLGDVGEAIVWEALAVDSVRLYATAEDRNLRACETQLGLLQTRMEGIVDGDLLGELARL